MSSSTSTTLSTSSRTSTTMFPLALFMSMMKNSLLTIYFYRVGFTFIFLSGFFGNIASLMTFSRPTLRKVSTGCLFMALAISDLTFLFISIIDYIEFGWQVSLFGHVAYNELCRFRSFMMNFTQFMSAWILVIVSVDRWIRSRFPFKAASICTRRNAWITVGVLIVISIGLHSHILLPAFGTLVPALSTAACGPNLADQQFSNFFLQQWSAIQIAVTCLIPALLMFLSVCDTFIIVRTRKRTIVGTNQAWEEKSNRSKTIHKQMFILIIASVVIFLITNLPVAIGKIIFPQNRDLDSDVIGISTTWTGLKVFQSLNYAINFYIHCLTSNLFRNEFQQRIKCCQRSRSMVTHIHMTTKV